MRPQMPNFKANNNAYHNLGCIKLGNQEKTIKQYRYITKKCKQISRPPTYLNVTIYTYSLTI